jgi:hypothetical protein
MFVAGYDLDKIAEKILYYLKLNSDNPEARFKLKQVRWYLNEEKKYPDIIIYMVLGILAEKGKIKLEKLGRSADFEENLRIRLLKK